MAVATRAVLTAGIAGILSVSAVTAQSAGPAVASEQATVTCPSVDSSPPYTVTPAPTPGVDWAGCNLSYGNLSGYDMSGADLTGANLTEAGLVGTDLQDAKMANTVINDAVVANTELTDADLTDASMESDQLYRDSFSGTILTGADLSYVMSTGISDTLPPILPESWLLVDDMFVGPTAVLMGVDLTAAKLSGADLSQADLVDANLTSATVTDGNLNQAELVGANLTDADLAGSDLTNANMRDVNLQDTNLAGTTLTMVSSVGITGTPASLPANWRLLGGTGFGYLIGPGAHLQLANLDGANLAGADLDGADLNYSQLAGATLANASLAGASLWQEDLSGASLTGADLTGADLTQANLTNADLDGASVASTIWAGVTWSNTVCPKGLNSNKYLAGCFSTLDTAPPVAHPGVPYGTPGADGWWISPVTVYWNWTDDGTIVPSQCQGSTTTSANGDSVTVTATCADLAGNVGHASEILKIDTSSPAVSVTGVRNGARYVIGRVPRAGCRTTDKVSGVKLRARLRVTTTGRHGLGRFVASCTGAVSVAGHRAGPVRVTYTVVRGHRHTRGLARLTVRAPR